MKIAAIPTMYQGVQFRSRLEARWAAFFDLTEVTWRYEPYDLPGWIPDFLVSDIRLFAFDPEMARYKFQSSVRLPIQTECLIEIKPIKRFGRADSDWKEDLWDHEAQCPTGEMGIADEARSKIDGASPALPVLLLGREPFAVAGSVYEYHVNHIGSGHASSAWVCDGRRIPSDPTSDRLALDDWEAAFVSYDKFNGHGATPSLHELWAEAGNRVQYKSPRGR